MTASVRRRIAVGAGWAAGLRLADRVIGLLSISILARLLVPGDFGLVAYAMTFYGLVEAFLQFGFESVLIRDHERCSARYDTAWTLGVLRGAAVSALLAIAAQPIAGFFSEPEVEMVVYWIALLPLLRALENIGVVDFQRDLTFDKEFSFQFSARLGAVAATVLLAWLLRSHWALVYGMVAGALLRVVLSYVMSDHRPRLDLSQFTAVFGFSKWLLVQNVFLALNERLPALAIGRFQGAQPLAYFNMSTELANFASVELSAPIRRVLFPGIARLAQDPEEMLRTVRLAIGVIVLAGLPAVIGIGLVAPLLVPLFLGERWNESVPLLQLLAVNAVVYVVLFSNSNVLYLVLGKPAITAYQSVLRCAILLPLLLSIVPEHGALGAAAALVATNTIILAVDYAFVLRMVPLRLKSILSAVWRSVLGTAVMAACVLQIQDAFAAAGAQPILALQLGICVTLGALVYGAVVFLLWWLCGKPDSAEAYVVRIISRSWSLVAPA